jgi:leader peptidase (prepilin peptidase)/N-methyltransferase
MNVALAVAALPPALALGSFLNVVAARLPEGRSLVSPPSACGSCGTRISWRDNVPVLSYVLLRGRCRHCGVRIGARYVAVELGTALLVAACFLHLGLTADAFVASVFVSVLVVLAAIGASLFLFLALLAYPRGMGMGDVKLCLLLGAMLGADVLPALMVGMLAALVPSAVLFVRHGAAARKMFIPFGPFLAFGGVVALFAGEALLDAYLGSF